MAGAELLLRGKHISRRWGGLLALNDVSIDVARGTVHAVIGTNGAGKSTLVNILSGEIPPSGGTVELLGQDVTHWTQPRRARAGLGRSYQRNTIYPSFSVLENCRLAAQASAQKPWAIWQDARRCPASSAAALAAAERAGLSDVLEREAGLLLDEPLAGMGAEETERMLALLQSLKATHAILLIEHDMDAVFRVADCITVMVNGGVIASGSPDFVRNSAEVRVAYLGEH